MFISGDKVPQDAQDHKNELNRITKYIMDLQEKVKKECDAFSEVGLKLSNRAIIRRSTSLAVTFSNDLNLCRM